VVLNLNWWKKVIKCIKKVYDKKENKRGKKKVKEKST
jgi:hypothetical protein